jgi:hypothetical protein
MPSAIFLTVFVAGLVDGGEERQFVLRRFSEEDSLLERFIYVEICF